MLKSAVPGVESLSAVGLKPMTSPSVPLSNSPSPVLTGQLPAPSSTPRNPSQISSLAGGGSPSSLEMLLLERAKLLHQQTNPVAKAFAELQGNRFSMLYGPFALRNGII